MKIVVISNPAAGGAHRIKPLARLIQILEQRGQQVSLITTTEPGHATDLAREAVADGADVVVAVGGDGTVNEVIQGLVGSSVPLAVYPAGTTNVWCRQILMPPNPARAAEVIMNGPRRSIDLGRAGERYFLLMAGVGYDGEITYSLDLKLKKRIGKLAYALAALQLAGHFDTVDVQLTLDPDGPSRRVLKTKSGLLIFTNIERYAVMKLARESRVDDGQLELLLFQTTNIWSKFARAFSLVTSRTDRDPHIARYRLREAILETDPPVAMQMDGDPIGRIGQPAVSFECVPQALTVIVPENAPHNLFSRN